MKVIILGAGVAGVASAWYFWRDGHEVTVLERNDGVALETSFANGGQLSYSYVAPLASASVIPKIPPWLLRRDSPLRFRPEMDPDQWRWIAAFLAACNNATAGDTTQKLLRLAFYSRDLMHELVDTHAMDFDYVQNGKLVVHTDPASFESARRLMEYQRRLGAEQEALDAKGCLAIEPALERFHAEGGRAKIAGAIYTPSEDAGDCYKFCNELKRIMTTGPNPVRYRFGVEVARLVPWHGRLMGVETSQGVMEADAYVLALGTNAPRLLKPLGVRVPVYPLKGYSLTLPIADPRGAPRISVTDFKRKVVYARLGGELRVAGMADLSGRRATLDSERVAQLVDEVRSAFPAASDFRELGPWCGMRPATPKGMPVIGATPHANLWLNVGHGALGFTLALATGRIVADLAAGRQGAVALDGFTLH
ncbi:MAG TPA: D-amino acid dehydrogenase [Usitatibacter sp.]|jgi:D-amino-acid dehydrogenase|nr:D-amino acid dehydrogenase [Usitatibacter sp.]